MKSRFGQDLTQKPYFRLGNPYLSVDCGVKSLLSPHLSLTSEIESETPLLGGLWYVSTEKQWVSENLEPLFVNLASSLKLDLIVSLPLPLSLTHTYLGNQHTEEADQLSSSYAHSTLRRSWAPYLFALSISGFADDSEWWQCCGDLQRDGWSLYFGN